MRFDFDPHTATTYTATVSTQIGPDLTAAAQAASEGGEMRALRPKRSGGMPQLATTARCRQGTGRTK